MIQPRTVAIHQPQYLPYLGFFHKIVHSDIFVLLDDVQFNKGGFQNRNKLKTSQGWQWITVPVLHDSKQLIRDVRINNEVSWQRKHWAALKTNYAPAPFFDQLSSDLHEILHREWNSLSDLNNTLTEWAMSALGIDTPTILSSTLKHSSEGTQRLIEICRELGASRYLSGPGGKNYMDLEAFSEASISVTWQDFHSPTYEQVFSEAGFQPDMAIVDALFCCGPGARRLLE